MNIRAKSLALLLLAALCGIGTGPAAAGEVSTGLKFPSAALRSEMTFSLYLPDSYAKAPSERFPVLYFLHGYGANDREWIELGAIKTTLDRMIASGEIPPVIAVMPYSGKSWYVDSAALGGPGDYETAIAVDLVNYIDRTYRAISDRKARAIAGISMGGYGAARMAFFHPTSFAAVATLSGALHQTDNIPATEQPLLLANLHNRAQVKYHGAYGTPFDMGVFVARNPFTRIAELSRTKSPPKILIMTGDDDFLKFYEGSCQLFVALRRAGLNAELRVDDGGHDWRLWGRQIPDVIRFLAGAIQTPQPVPAAEDQVLAGAAPQQPATLTPAAAQTVAQPLVLMPDSPAAATLEASAPAAPAATTKQAATLPAQKPAVNAQQSLVQPMSTKQIVRQPPHPIAQPAAVKPSTPAVNQRESARAHTP